MEQIFDSWKHSLQWCSFDHIKRVVRDTIALMQDVAHMLRMPWFFLTIALVMGVATLVAGFAGLFGSVISIVLFPVSTLFLIAARPTMEQKNFAYFKKCIVRALWPIIVMSVIMAIPFLSTFFMLLPAFFELYILVYLDYDGDLLEMFKRALKIEVYNYPLWFMYIVGFHFIVILFMVPLLLLFSFNTALFPAMNQGSNIMGIMGVLFLISTLISILLQLFIKCLIVTLYTKYIKQNQLEQAH